MNLEFYMTRRKEHKNLSVRWCSCEDAGCCGVQVMWRFAVIWCWLSIFWDQLNPIHVCQYAVTLQRYSLST